MKKLYLSSLKGDFGDWTYYPCLMKLKDVADRIGFADDIYKSKILSEMVQRTLKEKWGREIKEYLLSQKQRFFNSLIVAIYEGQPSWYEISDLEGSGKIDASEIPDDVIASIGILHLSGNERLFTLDGQHRLMGIKEAIETNPELGKEQLAVIFIAHRTDVAGMERSRRLFTTLNKNAKRVSTSDIIALDEDDTMAIIVRRLIEEHPMFQEERVSSNPTPNLPKGNFKSLTTMINLYDMLLILFTSVYGKTNKPKLTEKRLSDTDLHNYYENACNYFVHLTNTFKPLQEFLEAGNDYPAVTAKYRTANGGKMFFRPIGLRILTEIVSTLSQKFDISSCMTMISKLPQELTEEPLNGVIWHPTRRTINNRGKTLARNVLLFMLNEYDGNKGELHENYAKTLGLDTRDVKLPPKIKR